MTLTQDHRFTICVALRAHFAEAMQLMDLTAPHGSLWLKVAGDTWEAYRAFAGGPMESGK